MKIGQENSVPPVTSKRNSSKISVWYVKIPIHKLPIILRQNSPIKSNANYFDQGWATAYGVVTNMFYISFNFIFIYNVFNLS